MNFDGAFFLSTYTFSSLFVVTMLVYVYEEARLGLVRALCNFISVIVGYFAGLLLYSSLSSFVAYVLSIPKGFADALGFFSIVFLVGLVVRILFILLESHLTKISLNKVLTFVGGGICGLVSFFFLSLFFLTSLLSFPISPVLRKQITTSHVGSFVLSHAFLIENNTKKVFGQTVQDTLTFMTVKPSPDDFVELPFSVQDYTVSTTAENEMLKSINTERIKRNLPPIVKDIALQEAARSHAIDMARRGYFSHYTPEKKSPFDRLSARSIMYNTAGENLALAPDTKLAMQGLMESKGHRENILSPDFEKVGIGAVDLGRYGTMYVQEFSD